MPWVRFDDMFPIHRKVDGLSDAAFRLHVSAIFWCARNLTDGVLPEGDLDLVTARVRTPERFAAELVKRGAWHQAGQGCDSEDCPAWETPRDGWVIHDYFDFQPPKTEVVRKRKAKAERQRRWLEKRTKRDGVRDASQGASIDPPPYPPRPAPKEAGAGPPKRARDRPAPEGLPDPVDPHPVDNDGYGTCRTCQLPASHRSHLDTA